MESNESNESNESSDSAQAADMVAIMEDDLDVVETAAIRLEKAGIQSLVRLAGGAGSISRVCCYELAVASQDVEKAKDCLSDKRAKRARLLQVRR